MVEVELRGITKKFGDVTAAGDISLTIEDGEFFTLLGPVAVARPRRCA